MTRYQINVGDEFPLGEPGGGRRGPCGRGKAVKVLLFLSLAVITVSHPVPAALVLGAILLIYRSGWLHEARARWQRGVMHRRTWGGDRYWHGGGEPGAFV
jgi:hypothetical protein